MVKLVCTLYLEAPAPTPMTKHLGLSFVPGASVCLPVLGVSKIKFSFQGFKFRVYGRIQITAMQRVPQRKKS